MAAQETGEAHAESGVSEPEEEPTERRKAPRKSLLERVPWEVLGRWDPREINAEELDAAILEHAKEAFVAGGIAKLHFVKSTDKDLGGWKRKDYYGMRKDVVCYRYQCPLAYRSKCPAQLRLTKGLTSVVLEKKNSHDAEVHSKDHAKGLKWQQKESIAQAVSVAPLQSGTQIRRNLHRDSPEKRIDPSYNRGLCRECRIRRLISCPFFQACAARRLLVPDSNDCS